MSIVILATNSPQGPPDKPEEPEYPSKIAVSNFDYCLENHFKAVDTIAELCGYSAPTDADQVEIQRLSNSITFLREWRDFNYEARNLKFSCQHNLKEKDVIGGVTLTQFSAASVPKKEMGSGTESFMGSSQEFVMNVGGSVWGLDWCPKVNPSSENHMCSEFVAVAAHPPNSSCHKIGHPLTGRGAIQIWCFLTVNVKEPLEDSKISRPCTKRNRACMSNKPIKVPRPRGRPRKTPRNDIMEKTDINDQYARPLAVEFPSGSFASHSLDTSSVYASPHVNDENCIKKQKDCNQSEHVKFLSSTAHKVREKSLKTRKEYQVDGNIICLLRHCEQKDDLLRSEIPDQAASYTKNGDAITLNNLIPSNVALPRMMLCLFHNGKVAWDVKWQPTNVGNPVSMNILGFLAVLLGNGALEVFCCEPILGALWFRQPPQPNTVKSVNIIQETVWWEVPLPHTVKLAYPGCQEHIDPRFIKLQPVFRCSMLKFGGRQSIPLTMEWSVASPHDMILAGCHDGVVAIWKFVITDSVAETRPLLCFSADTGPIRTLAWAPVNGDRESANVIILAGHRGFKFWDIRDPFRPLWDHALQGGTYDLDWLPDPRCIFGALDDGTLWLLNLEKAANDLPVSGKSLAGASKLGLHSLDCSSFSIWCMQASRLTGAVAYCGEEGSVICFQPTVKSVRDPSRHRLQHYTCGSLFEEDSALIVSSPSSPTKRIPSMKRPAALKDPKKIAKEPTLAICSGIASNDSVHGRGKKVDEFEVFPAKTVAMQRLRWSANKCSEKWLCCGGAAGLLRLQEVDFTLFK